MEVAVVYESLFGNTHEVAEAIGRGVEKSQPGVHVSCVAVAEATPDLVEGADLLVVGGPTHMRGMTSNLSRKMGLQGAEKKAVAGDGGREPEPGAEGPGVRDWFHTLPKAAANSRAAAFDTRIDARLAGGAANGIARRLRGHGYHLVAEPEGFIIEDAEGPLRDGERARAEDWGTSLLR
jgi:flavodoxin